MCLLSSRRSQQTLAHKKFLIVNRYLWLEFGSTLYYMMKFFILGFFAQSTYKDTDDCFDVLFLCLFISFLFIFFSILRLSSLHLKGRVP